MKRKNVSAGPVRLPPTVTLAIMFGHAPLPSADTAVKLA